MINLNTSKKNFSDSIAMKRMLSILLSVALIMAWCPSGFATAETIAVSPWTSDAIGQQYGYSINDGGTTFTLNVTGSKPNIFTDNIAGPYNTQYAASTVNAGFSNIVFSSNSEVYGTIGATASFADLTLTGANAVNFWGTVNTTTMHVALGSTADFKSITNSNNAAITFTGDGFVTLDAGTEVTGAITTAPANTGTLTLNSASVLHGAVGGATGLKDIAMVGSNVSATISGAVNTYKLDLLNNTLHIGGALTVAPGGIINVTVTAAGAYGHVITTGAVTIGAGTVINEVITGTAPIYTASQIVNNYTAPITLAVTSSGTAQAAAGNTTIGALSGSGNIDLSAPATLITGGANTNTTYSGAMSGAGGGLTKVGIGTLTLTGTNTYTGTTAVNDGTLALDFSVVGAPVNNIIAAASALDLDGGTLLLTGSATAANSQTFNGLTLSPGGSAITLTTNVTPHDLVLNLGAITHQTGGTVNITQPSGVLSATNGVTTSHVVDASGILGTWATVGNAGTLSYAEKTGTNITAYSGATTATAADLSNVLVATTNYKYAAATDIGAGVLTGNTLQYIGAATTTNLNTGTLTLNGLMNSGTGLLTISGGAAAGLITGANNELVIFDNGSGITISSVISGAGAVVYGGPSAGALTLNGVNTYSGGSYLNAGTLNIGNGQALGLGGTFTISGGTLDATGGARDLTNNHAQTWSGNFAFTGSNTLDLGDGAVTMTGDTTITANASTLTVGGVIGDGGNGYGITKAGAGTLILSGVASTYTGQTVINAGTLQVAKLAAGGVNSSLGATVATTPIVLGDGVHAATLDYTGTTGDTSDRQFVVTLGSAGTIKASNAGFVDLGLSGMVANNGGITFDVTLGAGAGKLTESGVISGAGTLTKLGTGTLALSGANTYTGVTTISAGILQIGAGAGTGKLDPTGGIVDNATLEIDRTGTITQSTDLGVISGSGVVNLIGAGTTIFDLTNTYAGATTITAGILQIGAGAGTGKLNPTGGIVDNATLVINRTGTVTQSTDLGVISGGGVVNLTGAGTTVFDLANTYTGLTDVQAGTLSLIGGSAIANAANVQVSGGTLNVATSETVHNVALNSGTISLGSNTLSAGGTYTQLAGATLSLNITSPTASGSVAATGNGAIAPTSIISLNVASGVYIAGGSNWNVITSGGNGGLNAPVVTDNSYVLGFTPTVSGNNILITANRVNAYNTLSTNNGNDNAVGAALESAGPGATGDMLTVLNTLDSMGSAQQITNALETMTPDVSSGALTASRAMAENSFKMVGNRLGGARNVSEGSGVSSGDMTNGVGVWIQGLGSNMKQDERKGVQGFSANTWGTTIGADKVIDDHFRAGLAGGYSWAGVNSKTPGSPSDDINSYQATIYGSYDSLNLNKARQGAKKSPEAVRNQEENSWYVDGMLGFTENDYDSRREIWLTPASGRVAKADHSGQQYSTNFEGGYTFTFKETKALEVTPFASIGYNYLRMNSYKEKGANALDLSVQGDGFHQLEQAIGTKLAYPIVAKKVGTFIPSAKAAWLYDYIGDRFETNASFAGGGSSFTTKGAKPAKNGMLFGAELAFLNKGNVTVTGNWDITLKDQFMSNTYYGTVRYDF